MAVLPKAMEDRAEIDVFVNADGSVDGQLRVRKLSQRADLKDLLLDLERILSDRRHPSTWMSIGFRFPHDVKVEARFYNRWRGMLQTQTYYQRMTDRKMPVHFQTTRKLLRDMKKHGRRVPKELFLSLRWNPGDVKPTMPKRKVRKASIKDMTEAKLRKLMKKGRKP